jgi:hypothetical protein
MSIPSMFARNGASRQSNLRHVCCLTLWATLLAACSDSQPQVIASDAIIVKEDQWFRSSFVLDQPASVQVSISLEQGPSVDVYVVDQQGLNKWETVVSRGQLTGGGFEHYAALGVESLSSRFTSSWGALPAGSYALIIDNTDHGATAPPMNMADDVAEVKYQILVKAP